jgi:LysM domain
MSLRWIKSRCMALLLAQTMLSGHVTAQEEVPDGDEAQAPAPGTPVTVVLPAGGAAGNTANPPAASPYGFPSAGFDPNAHLNSGSRARVNIDEGDSFDLGSGRGEGVQTVKGNADAPGVFTNGGVSAGMYLVKPGDTLSKIASQAFGERLMWPKLWSLNPQIQNPHWIYPGDQIVLDAGGSAGRAPSRVLGSGAPFGKPQVVHQDAVFLRELGYIDDPAEGVLGEVIGAREEVQLITQNQHAYLELRPNVDVQEGQELTVFTTYRDAPKVRGARRPPGKLVAIIGTVEVEYFNAKTRVARVRVVEALDVIERGAKVGLLDRTHLIVAPESATKNVAARVLTSMYPNEFMGRNDVLFLDRGTDDGLAAGNRLFVIRRGDTWRRTLSTTSHDAASSLNMNSDKAIDVSPVPLHGDENDFPEEVIGELRVIKAHKFSSFAVVVSASFELKPGDKAVARVGF